MTNEGPPTTGVCTATRTRGRQRLFTDEELLAALKGHTHAQAAELLGCSENTVGRRARGLGRERTRGRQRLFTDEELLAALEGRTHAQVAELLGCSRSSVSMRARALGYGRRKSPDLSARRRKMRRAKILDWQIREALRYRSWADAAAHLDRPESWLRQRAAALNIAAGWGVR